MRASSDPAATLDWLRHHVTTDLEAALEDSRSRTTGVGPEIAETYAIGRRLLRGGKRLRAAFAYLGWVGHTGGAQEADPAAVLRAGVGLEFFQMAALVHDDVIDGSQTRRGMPAAHHQFAEQHGARQMMHDEGRFGQAGAILLGDLMMVLATHELAEAAAMLPAEPASTTRRIVTDMMSEVTLGQYLDIYAQSAPWSAQPAEDVERAHRVVVSKSARYSVEHPLLLGAAIAGADGEQLATTRAIGLPIGEAFQLRDDVLGIFGDPEVTGKPSGDDLREGKRTLLITTALAATDPARAEQIRAVLGSAVSDDDVAMVREILTDTGALAQVEQMITDRSEQALAAIDASAWPAPAQDLARHLARAAISRST